mgnify:CR=1 FL=1|jgi:hypothetical protein
MSKLYELAEEYNELLEMMEDDSVDMEVLRDTLESRLCSLRADRKLAY